MTEITIVETIRQSLPIKDGDILEQIKKIILYLSLI